MSRFSKILISSVIATSFIPFTASAALGDRFQVIDFDFSLTCDSKPLLGTPQFPDVQFAFPIVIENAIFTDGQYNGQTPAPNTVVSTYMAFHYFDAPVSNYTAPTGVDGGSHPPPTFDLNNLTVNLSSFYAYWNGTEFNQGDANVALIDNLDGTFQSDHRSLIVGGTFDGCTGRWKMRLDCLDCPPSQLGVSPVLAASQGNSITRTIITTNGNATISSTLGRTPTGVSFGWAPSDNSIVETDGISSDGSFTFDPSSLSPGNYSFIMDYSDNTTTPSTKGKSSITIKVVSAYSGDNNDDNNNGITNADDDTSLTSSQLMAIPGNANSYILQASSGNLKLGKTAFCSTKAALIDANDIATLGSSSCGAVTNASDDQIKAVGIGGYFDFEIHELTAGELVQVVLPLSAAIPNNATYRKYHPSSGWAIFDATDTDSLASSNSFSDGVCPVPLSLAYTPGLTAGHTCVRLSITDGGPNDTDDSANGVIVDPGAVAEIQSGVEAELSSGCSLGAQTRPFNHHLEWLLAILFISFVGYKGKQKKQQ